MDNSLCIIWGIYDRAPFSVRYSMFWTEGENSPLSADMDNLLCTTRGISARAPFSARYSVFWTDGENSPLSADMDNLLCITWGICARAPFSARYSMFWTEGENSPLSADMDNLLCITWGICARAPFSARYSVFWTEGENSPLSAGPANVFKITDLTVSLATRRKTMTDWCEKTWIIHFCNLMILGVQTDRISSEGAVWSEAILFVILSVHAFLDALLKPHCSNLRILKHFIGGGVQILSIFTSCKGCWCFRVSDQYMMTCDDSNQFRSKILQHTISNGCEVRTENSVFRDNCSASFGKRCDAEQLSRVMEFSICTEQPLWILFLAYSTLENCIKA